MSVEFSYTEEKLLEYIIEKNVFPASYINLVKTHKQHHNINLELIIIELKILSPVALQKVKSEALGYKFIDLSSFQLNPNLEKFMREDLRLYNALPIDYDHPFLNFAVCDPDDFRCTDGVKRIVHQLIDNRINMNFYCADYGQILSVWAKNKPVSLCNSRHNLDILDDLIEQAINENISDIHFQPSKHYVKVKYRKDGILEERLCLHSTKWYQIFNKLKVLAGVDIVEFRKPQTGKFVKNYLAKDTVIRFSSHPCYFGENVVLRLISNHGIYLSLEKLGFPDTIYQEIIKACKLTEGLIIISGPTGSGKTTTLYGLIDHLSPKTRNIMTLEAPIETILDGISQTELSENKFLSYSDGIRSLLRQDPDIIIVGEIRDEDTARMVMRAALTGHLVITTLHVGEVADVPQRLIELGVNPTLLSGVLSLCIAQKLVRIKCSQCSGFGCERCHDGFNGRQVLAESMSCDPNLSKIILNGADRQKIIAWQNENKLNTFKTHADFLIANNITTSSEIKRVANIDV